MILHVFVEVMIPILILTGFGGLVARWADMPVVSLSKLVFNLFTPALVFYSLVTLDIAPHLVSRIALVVTLVFVTSACAGYGLALIALQRRRSIVAGITLCSALANMGNMGLPISALAFGIDGLGVAVVAFVTGVVLTHSIGIMIATLAGESIRQALLAPLRVPPLWAVMAGLIVNSNDLLVPEWINATAEVLAGAAIPAMLVVLGLQLMTRLPTVDDLSEILVSVGVRLVAGPLIAVGATILFGLSGVPQRTLIVLGGMPTAVMTTIIATQYDAEPGLVSRTVVMSTVASFVTLTVLLSLV